jgi:hypothetical protein
MSTDTPNKALAAAAAVKEALREYRQHVADLNAEEVALRQKKKELEEMPIPIEDVKQVMLDYVDAQAKNFLADGELEKQLREFVYPTNSSLPRRRDNGLQIKRPLNYLDAEHIRTGDLKSQVYDADRHPKLYFSNITSMFAANTAHFFYFGSIIKEKLSAYFDALGIDHHPGDRSKVGPPIAERIKTFAEIDAQLSKVISERSKMDEQIRALVAP